ncbi:MAG: ATP-binding protein [bacterium]
MSIMNFSFRKKIQVQHCQNKHNGGNLIHYRTDKKSINGYFISYFAIALLFLLMKPWAFSSPWISTHDSHSLLEIVQTFIAIGVGVISTMSFLVLNNPYYLLIGLGFSIAASSDFIHGILSYGPLFASSHTQFSRFIPCSYVIGKCFLAAMIIAAPLLDHVKWGPDKKRVKRTIFFSLGVFVLSGSVTASSFFLPLPQFIYPERFISRPVDFFSAILFAIAFILVLKRFLAKRDVFSGLILNSILLNFCGQVYMSFSRHLFDSLFNIAHIAHFFSYVMPLVAIPMQGLTEINIAHHEIDEHKKTEEELTKYQDYLEQLVKERTRDLESTNEQLTRQVYTRMQAQQELKDAYEALQETYEKLKESQNQLIQSEKMNALGTMVAGVAHEMNNPMMSILNYAQYCLKHTTREASTYQPLLDIENETKRCIDVIKDLLTFSRREEEGEEGYQKASCTELIDRVLKLMSYRIEKQNVSIQKDIDETLPEVWMKVNNIQQVFFNLVHNALDAVKEKERQEICIQAVRQNDRVEVSIADNGCGIAPEHLQKIFDPFFTTKPTGEGTGLGLSICRSIIAAHKGKMGCESQAGSGSTFKILLPIERQKEDYDE